jgi:hypothetical protein
VFDTLEHDILLYRCVTTFITIYCDSGLSSSANSKRLTRLNDFYDNFEFLYMEFLLNL